MNQSLKKNGFLWKKKLLKKTWFLNECKVHIMEEGKFILRIF